MTRSRLTLIASLSVVGLGVAAALGALLLDPARAAIGPLPPQGRDLPADSRFVAGFDVKRVVASPFYQKHMKATGTRPQVFEQLEAKLGLDPERDVERIVLAGGGQPKDGRGVALVLGRFDRGKLQAALEANEGVLTAAEHRGTRLHVLTLALPAARPADGTGAQAEDAQPPAPMAVALLDESTLALGTRGGIETVIENRAAGGALERNAELVGLLGRVKPGAAFWIVGDGSLLSELPRQLGSGGPSGSGAPGGLNLPAIETLVVSAELDPLVAVQITADARDEAAARSLADVVRGFVGLIALQSAQKPELQQLASAVSVTTEARQVHLNARFPYELIEALRPTPSPEPKAEPPAGAER